MSNKAVLYHENCFDGFTAAWILSNSANWWDANFIAVSHGDEPPPGLLGKHVLIVDFSYKRSVLEKLLTKVASLQVWDHHASAALDLRDFPGATFDMDRSGAGLAWDLAIRTARTWLVNVVEDRDLWRFKFETTKACNAYMATQDFTFENWTRMMNLGEDECARRGGAVMEYIAQYGRNALSNSRQEFVRVNGGAGYRVPTVNIQYMNASEHLHELLEQNPGCWFVVSYFRQGDGRWRLSFRCRDNYDVAKVAEYYGGGGHQKAAGAIVDVLPWEAE